MKATVVEGIPRLHTVANPEIKVSPSNELIVEADDRNERRFRLVFSPFQGIKIITIDCYKVPEALAPLSGHVMEISNSEWMDELRRVLSRKDETATFMDKARHFMVPLGDAVLEVVAWRFSVSYLEPA